MHVTHVVWHQEGEKASNVQRHIDNPNKHDGNARVIPFVEYIAGRAAGKYPIISNSSRSRATHCIQNLEDRQTKGSFFDRIHEKAEEKIIDRIA
jgi:hypothetical protein